MLQSTVVAARLPADEAAQFQDQARRHGLTPSRALQALVEGALLAEQAHDVEAGGAADRA